MVAWLTCWYMSMSDHRTGTGATKPIGSAHPVAPRPLVRVIAADLARRHRQRRQIPLTALVDFAAACAAPAPPGTR